MGFFPIAGMVNFTGLNARILCRMTQAFRGKFTLLARLVDNED